MECKIALSSPLPFSLDHFGSPQNDACSPQNGVTLPPECSPPEWRSASSFSFWTVGPFGTPQASTICSGVKIKVLQLKD